MTTQQSLQNTAYDIPEQLQGFACIHQHVVEWNDMDAYNHVNNVVFYRYAESARIHYLYGLKVFNTDVVTVLAQSSCTYLAPVTYPDTLLIGVRTKKLGSSSLVMEYCYFSSVQQKVVATADSVLVRLNSQGTAKVEWSEQERDAILSLEQSVGHTPEH